MADEARVARGRMGRVDRQPQHVRDTINKMDREGAHQTEILDAVNPDIVAAGDDPISPASLSRYLTRPSRRALAENARAAAVVAEALAQPAEDGIRIDRGLQNLLQQELMALLLRLRQEELPLDERAELISQLTLTLQRNTRATHYTDRREREVRAEERAAAIDRASKAARRANVPEDKVAAIREAIEGAE